MSTSSVHMKVQHVKEGFNSQRSNLAVFIDFVGAYDTVWQSKLISKLKNIEVGDIKLVHKILITNMGKDTVERF